ncbi:hypothetical protein [Klenkia terrae]|uniref:Uncharacterized protein n=1 Tax=Klenkia terrae TaxID=1052259 RepID=A0ABU8E437_9ACTN|nr:hypothetical protein [Klenkia terrae]
MTEPATAALALRRVVMPAGKPADVPPALVWIPKATSSGLAAAR